MYWPDLAREYLSDLDERFQERYGRPAPWYRLLDDDEIEDIAWQISSRLGSPARRLKTALQLVCDRLPLSDRDAVYMGWTEPLSAAAPRCGFQRTEFVLYLRDSLREVQENPVAVAEIALADMIQFEQTLWHDDAFLIDTDCRWIAWGPHDHNCQFLRLRDQS